MRVNIRETVLRISAFISLRMWLQHPPRFSGELSLRRVPSSPFLSPPISVTYACHLRVRAPLPRGRGAPPPRRACARGARLRRSGPTPFCGFGGAWAGAELSPWPSPPPPHHFHHHHPPAPPPRRRCPSSLGSLAHTCPCRPRGARSPPRRRPLPGKPPASSRCARPGAPGGGRRWPSRGALLFWVLCVINVGPPHSNQAHYKFLRARGRKSCAPPAPSLTHSLVTCLSAF